MTYDIRNLNLGFRQAQKCGKVKPVNGVITVNPPLFTIVSPTNTVKNKRLKKPEQINFLH